MINTQFPDKVALIYRDIHITYNQLFSKINQFSGFIKGNEYDKIAIFSENRLEWIYAFYAAWQKGCMVVPIDAGSSAEDVQYILNDCKPGMVFTSADLSAKFKQILQTNEFKPQHCIFDEIKQEDQDLNTAYHFIPEPDKTAVIIYTSGTTGFPKGVMLSYANLMANVRAVSEDVIIYTPERQVLLLLPLHHIFPLAGSMMVTLFVGSTVVMSPTMQSSDLMETFKNNKISIVIGVPRLYELIYNGLKAKIFASFIGKLFYHIVKLSGSRPLAKKIFKKVHIGLGGHVDFMVCGGASLEKEIGQFYKVLGFEVLEGYGMTEAAPMITFTRPGRVLVGSPGEALPKIKIEIRDGEIVAKGENVMKGYYNKPEETSEALKDGWLYTGDLGYMDKNGFLHITGRKKDLIVLSNGKNISPVELETKLSAKYQAINDAAVFLHKGQLHAVILPDFKYLSENHVKDIQEYVKSDILPDFNKDLSSYKRIMQFSVVNQELPRTKLGKIQRFKLAEFIEKGTEKKKSSEQMDCEEYKSIKTFIEGEVDMEISANDHLEYDIALDSLGKLSLIDYIEKNFGVKISEESLLSFPSIKQMVEYVKNNKLWHKIETTNWTEILKERVNLKLPKSWPTINIIKSLSKLAFKVYFRFKGKGYQNVPEGPCIIVPNHQSYFDGLFVASFLKWKTMKATYFYAKKKHVNNWFLKFIASRNNVIVMDLNKGLQESIQKMAEVLRKGKKVIIFPEGTRSKNGEVGEFKKMFAILSKEINVPVVPVAIRGAFNALPSGKLIPRAFTRVEVNFMQPVYPDQHTHDTLTEEVYNQISKQVNQLN
jgi:long-chain acyl-CoA synthetase